MLDWWRKKKTFPTGKFRFQFYVFSLGFNPAQPSDVYIYIYIYKVPYARTIQVQLPVKEIGNTAIVLCILGY